MTDCYNIIIIVYIYVFTFIFALLPITTRLTIVDLVTLVVNNIHKTPFLPQPLLSKWQMSFKST